MNKIIGLKISRTKGMWKLSTDFFGTEISSYAKTFGRAHAGLQRMFDERMHTTFKRVWDGIAA